MIRSVARRGNSPRGRSLDDDSVVTVDLGDVDTARLAVVGETSTFHDFDAEPCLSCTNAACGLYRSGAAEVGASGQLRSLIQQRWLWF